MKILFAKIASLMYYKGITDVDKPKYGGEYVKRTGDAHEKYNFCSVTMEDGSEKCLGFFELKATREYRNQLHIEKIAGCKNVINDDEVDDVLVIWCALRDKGMPRIVGWYKHATVYRKYQEAEFEDGYIQLFNVIADAKNVTLIPWQQRGLLKYEFPLANKDGYGFGKSMQWYASEPEAQEYVKRVVDMVEKYNGENDLYKECNEV